MTTSRTLSRHTDRLDVPPSAGTKTWVAIDPRGNFRNYLATLGKPSRVRRRSATLLILLCLLASSPLQPQHVQGRVLFGSEPVGSATISLFDSSMNVLATSSTSAEGWFLINASSRARSLAVKRLGFRPTYVEVQSSHTDDTLQITIRLERISISLSPVVVRVEVDALKDFRIRPILPCHVRHQVANPIPSRRSSYLYRHLSATPYYVRLCRRNVRARAPWWRVSQCLAERSPHGWRRGRGVVEGTSTPHRAK